MKMIKYNKIKCYLSLLVFIISIPLNLLSNIKEPKPPEEPNITETKSTNIEIKSTKKTGKKEISSELFAYNVTIIFEDKTILSGIISFPKDSIKVTHKKKGFIFRKTIKWDDVKNLRIVEWKAFAKNGSTNRNLILYYFYPYKWKITTKAGKIYEYKGKIPYLHKLILTNEDGSTDIYSYFVDYWKITGKKSGYWKNAKSVDFYYPFKHPNKKVFKIINFK